MNMVGHDDIFIDLDTREPQRKALQFTLRNQPEAIQARFFPNNLTEQRLMIPRRKRDEIRTWMGIIKLRKAN